MRAPSTVLRTVRKTRTVSNTNCTQRARDVFSSVREDPCPGLTGTQLPRVLLAPKQTNVKRPETARNSAHKTTATLGAISSRNNVCDCLCAISSRYTGESAVVVHASCAFNFCFGVCESKPYSESPNRQLRRSAEAHFYMENCAKQRTKKLVSGFTASRKCRLHAIMGKASCALCLQ